MALITKYAHVCDRCSKKDEHEHVTMPKDWTVAEIDRRRYYLCAECTAVLKTAVGSSSS